MQAAAELDVEKQNAAQIARERVIGRLAESCSAYGAHVLASDRTYEISGLPVWPSPLAERLADEIARIGEDHPLVTGWKVDPDRLWLALKAVSLAVGRIGKQLQWQAIPANTVGVLPNELWLDTGKSPIQGNQG